MTSLIHIGHALIEPATFFTDILSDTLTVYLHDSALFDVLLVFVPPVV